MIFSFVVQNSPHGLKLFLGSIKENVDLETFSLKVPFKISQAGTSKSECETVKLIRCLKRPTFIQVDEFLVHLLIPSLGVLGSSDDMSPILDVVTNRYFLQATFRILQCFSCFFNLLKNKGN